MNRYSQTLGIVFSTALLHALSGTLAGQVREFPTLDSMRDKGWGIVLVQSLLNEVSQEHNLEVDGIGGPKTSTAVKACQRSQGLTPNGIVERDNWRRLLTGRERFLVEFSHPKWNETEYLKNDPLYESQVAVFRISKNGFETVGKFQGSLKPDFSVSQGKRVGIRESLKEHGVIQNGAYELSLGFHNRRGAIPTKADLQPKTSGSLRPCLVVNRDRPVPCFSKLPNKKTSTFIHIHNGFVTGRDSAGCLTIRKTEWSGFIKIFLNRYPQLDDWYTGNPQTYFQKSIGVLVVKDQ